MKKSLLLHPQIALNLEYQYGGDKNLQLNKARLHDSVLGTARLNLGTRTYEFWHGTLNFCRVNRYKTGPRAQKF